MRVISFAEAAVCATLSAAVAKGNANTVSQLRDIVWVFFIFLITSAALSDKDVNPHNVASKIEGKLT